jgi:hypothetical protein
VPADDLAGVDEAVQLERPLRAIRQWGEERKPKGERQISTE